MVLITYGSLKVAWPVLFTSQMPLLTSNLYCQAFPLICRLLNTPWETGTFQKVRDCVEVAHLNLIRRSQFLCSVVTRGQSDLTMAAPNYVRTVKPSWATWLTDWWTDTAHICNNSLHRMHSMQPNKYHSKCSLWDNGPQSFSQETPGMAELYFQLWWQILSQHPQFPISV